MTDMARQAALPPTLAPRIVSREAAAAYISVSVGTFDRMVEDGRMPRPKLLHGSRKGWDVRALDAAVDRLPADGPTVDDPTWADVDASPA